MNLSLIIPVYNFEKRISTTLEYLRRLCASYGDEIEVILVNDGSTDGTSAILAGLTQPFQVVNVPTNSGKGAAVKAGVAAARGAYIFFTDADIPYDLNVLEPACHLLRTGHEVVLGSRTLKGSSSAVERTFTRRLSSYVFSRLANFVLLRHVTDTQCGFKGFRNAAAKDIFNQVKSNGFVFDVELIYLVQKNQYSVALIPVHLIDDADSSVHMLRDSFKMIHDLFWLFIETRFPFLVQFLRYGLIGVYNTVVNFAIFNALIWLTGISTGLPVIGFSLIAFVIVIIQSFFINKKWVFKNTEGSHRRQFTAFFLVSGLVALFNLGLIQIIVNVIGAPEGVSTHLWANVALLITIITSVIGNFLGYKLIVFR